MIQSILQFLRGQIAVFFIVGVTLLLCITNYTPNTFLSGWDTLHPEFNFRLNISREFFGTFRADQGLGIPSVHSIMADLPHTLILYVLSLFFPMNMLRYLYIFLCLFAGPIGMYALLQTYLGKKEVSFIGSLFYLLNLGTMQQFIVPYEMFTTQYALLPWIFWSATNAFFAVKNERSYLLFFFFFSLLATPMAYAATLWYVYALTFVLYLGTLTIFCVFRTKQTTFFLTRFSVLFLLLLLSNAFWLLPNLYTIQTKQTMVEQATVNQLFSPQAFLYNKAYGDILDVAQLKTFYFGWQIYQSTATTTNLLNSWNTYLNNPLMVIIHLFFLLLAGMGILFVVRKQNMLFVSFLPPLLVALFFMVNQNFPFTHLFTLLQTSPLLKEAFRFPQDKVLGLFTFLFSVFVAVGYLFITRIFENLPRLKKLAQVTCTILLLLSMLPGFGGNFIHPDMRIAIPSEYFDLFRFFQTQQSTGTIAVLPIHSPFGWNYYHWKNHTPSFQGSGFISFGIAQGLLDRDADRWNIVNQNYYQDLSYAVYAHNSQLMQSLFTRYHIQYVLLDTSVIAPGENPTVLQYPQLQQLLVQAHTKQIAVFGNHLFVYQTMSLLPTVQQTLQINTSNNLSPLVFSNETAIAPFLFSLSGMNEVQGVLPFFASFQSPSTSLSSFPILVNNHINDCPSPTGNATKTTTEQTITYTSTNASFCDHIPLPHLSHQAAYLITIQVTHHTGLPLQLCMRNIQTFHCDITACISPDNKAHTFYLPPMGQGYGYSLSFTNTGIGTQPTSNTLTFVAITPLTTSLYQPIVTPSQPSSLPLTYFPSNNRQAYSVSPTTTTAVSFITLAQAFDPGWRAYQIQKSKIKSQNDIVQLLPFVFGKELTQHLILNNWENGWVISNNGTMKQSSNEKITLLYLPQYLEYLGFFLGAMTALLLSIRRSE